MQQADAHDQQSPHAHGTLIARSSATSGRDASFTIPHRGSPPYGHTSVELTDGLSDLAEVRA